MKVYLNGRDVTQLVPSLSTSGSGKECARTLSASIVQSPTDANLPVVAVEVGMPMVMEADGQYFVGSVMSVQRSTASNTVSFTAKDHGIYVKRNKVSIRIKEDTAEAAAADICTEYGIPTGYLASTGFQFSRLYTGVSMYDAIMTGYSLAAAENGKKYYLYMDGTAVCVGEKSGYIAAVIAEGENLIEASYSESIENMINQVDIIDEDGKIVQSVTGDISYGVMRDQVKLSDKEDGVAKAEEMIRDNGVKRTATIKNLGNAACTSGNAIMVRESFTGLFGKFYISADTHSWKNGIYTNSLTLEWEATMDEKSAGEAIDSSTKKKSSGGSSSGGDAGMVYVDYYGEKYEWNE